MSGLSGRKAYPDDTHDKLQDAHLAYKDAIFLSPHKLVGGPGSSGILVAKKKIFANKRPQFFGGGMVMYVNEESHEFLADMEEVEEAGTPGILQDIRASLVY
jgi:selenocysteine lyase/cysteine desulfurase